MSSMHATVPDAVVEIQGLTRRFGPKLALDQVSLTVPAGTVVGLVGENGAGKTTLIKHVLGLLRAETGSVRVFGRDPVADPVGVLSRIGYLSERSEEHTSELQSHSELVCRLLLEKKKKQHIHTM